MRSFGPSMLQVTSCNYTGPWPNPHSAMVELTFGHVRSVLSLAWKSTKDLQVVTSLLSHISSIGTHQLPATGLSNSPQRDSPTPPQMRQQTKDSGYKKVRVVRR